MKFQTKCKSTVTHVVIANQAPKVGKVRGLGVERLGYKKWASPVHEPTQDMMQISISVDPCDRNGATRQQRDMVSAFMPPRGNKRGHQIWHHYWSTIDTKSPM